MQRYPNLQWSREAWSREADQVNKQLAANKLKQDKTEAISIYPKRNFTKSLAAASMDSLTPILKNDQLKQCALSYINNGIVRTIIDRTVYFINPERSDFVIEPNEELTVGLDDSEIQKLEDDIKNDTVEGAPDIKGLRQKLTRYNKRVKLHDRTDKLLTNALIFGRGALQRINFPNSNEPRALKPLQTMRIKEIIANEATGEFEGLTYDDGKQRASGPKRINAEDLIPAFHGDNNILDNSNYSGVSLVWPVLEAANVIDVILAEDMPEISRQSWSKFGIMYAGTSKKSTIKKLKEELEAGTWLVHNEQQLTADVHDLSLDPMKLMDVCNSLSKQMCMSMNIPEFLLFEDTANFATANQVMQCYKAGMLKRYRTWLQGILEDYWYDPILADHLGIELKDVISAPIKIKALFQDINFETRLDIITADEKLQNMMVFTNVDTAKDIDRKDIANRLQVENTEINKAVAFQKDQDIKQQMADGKTQTKQGTKGTPANNNDQKNKKSMAAGTTRQDEIDNISDMNEQAEITQQFTDERFDANRMVSKMRGDYKVYESPNHLVFSPEVGNNETHASEANLSRMKSLTDGDISHYKVTNEFVGKTYEQSAYAAEKNIYLKNGQFLSGSNVIQTKSLSESKTSAGVGGTGGSGGGGECCIFNEFGGGGCGPCGG